MYADETDQAVAESDSANPRRRRRRRRRRRKDGTGDNGQSSHHHRNRDSGPPVSTAGSGKVPVAKLPLQVPRGAPESASGRRRRLTRTQMDELTAYLEQLPDALVANLYKGMGGQPDRVSGPDRMIQLSVRALSQGSRMTALLKSLHQRDRQALAILVQCGGIGQCEEFVGELQLSLGGTDREWKKVMTTLGEKGLVAASEERDGLFFYLIPEPLMEHLIKPLHEDLQLPGFDHEDMRVIDEETFTPPLTFSLTSLCTYIDQHPPRLTQRHDIYKGHKDEMNEFFSQLWTPDSEVFNFHIDFLMMNGLVELKGDRLTVNHAVLEEWIHLEHEDQRELVFSTLDKRFDLAEWVMLSVQQVDQWVPERPLQALYRRWVRGADWRDRLHKDQWQSPRSAERESHSFTYLVNSGMLELGQWGQEKFYRLTERAKALLQPLEDEGFTQFYLTPNFEIMAPAAMAPVLFFRIGELAELTACDRANTYKITEVSIEQAVNRGWKRDDVFEFLREYSQIGLPENVEQTLRGWMGPHSDVELHELMLLTVHKSQIRRLEAHRGIKPFIVHRFTPGMYAVDRTRMSEMEEALKEAGFVFHGDVKRYPDDASGMEGRARLVHTVVESRADREDPVTREHRADTAPDILHVIPGSRVAKGGRKRKRADNQPRRVTPTEARSMAESAIAESKDLRVLYVTKGEQRKQLTLRPERLAITPAGVQVLVALDVKKDERLSYAITQIERMAVKG